MANKTFKIAVFLLVSVKMLVAQNVGIGLSNPTYALDVLGSVRLQHSTNTAGLWFDGATQPTRSFIGSFSDDYFGFYGSAGASWNFLIHNTNNNIGLGVTNPGYRLDVNGRMRIKNNTNSAGIWFDGISLPTRSFIGTQNDNNFGIFGNGGAGWNFIMNINNGYFGIGTANPAKKLDVNGTLRIRSNAPIKGSVLTSKDAQGNAEWASPVTFRGEGLFDNVVIEIPDNTWTKVFFNQSPVYNYGNNYQPNTSVFITPTNGIYEFNVSLGQYNFANILNSIRLVVERNGIVSTLGEVYNKGVSTSGATGYFHTNANLTSEFSLVAGDKVWVEVFTNGYYSTTGQISSNGNKTFFSGNLIAKN